jgi:hypothetical protein
VRARLVASPATARALHLRHRLIAIDRVSVSGAGRVALGLHPAAAARRALARAHRATLSLDVVIGTSVVPSVKFVVSR